MKVSELMGPLLDYWAGKADKKGVFIHDCIDGKACSVRDHTTWSGSYNYSPSTDWAQGGPLIEKYGIDTTVVAESCYGDDLPNAKRAWRAERDEWDEYWGKTPLEAAMRCYVASKFGEEVPDE